MRRFFPVFFFFFAGAQTIVFWCGKPTQGIPGWILRLTGTKSIHPASPGSIEPTDTQAFRNRPGTIFPASAWNDVSFSFTLPKDATTSAGIFTKDGILLRTLWSNVKYTKGNYTQAWNGEDDERHLVPDGSYDIRVLSNNVRYEWEGVVGNTSKAKTGGHVFRGFNVIEAMAFTGNNAYFTSGYSEGSVSHGKFLTTDPQSSTLIAEGKNGLDTHFIATDGTTVYWGGSDDYAPRYQKIARSFVFATKVSDDSEVLFLNGASKKMAIGKTYASSIALVEASLAAGPNNTKIKQQVEISGIAVHRANKYLFVSYGVKNEIHVFDKTTGAFVRIIAGFATPRRLTFDKNGNLWVVSGTNTIQKYSVNTDGTLTPSDVIITGTQEPLTLGASPVDPIITVADAGNNQQVKAFDITTGAPAWTLGQKGGYETSEVVTNDKFYFKDVRGPQKTFIAFAHDGSFWVGDPGNDRRLHFSGNRTFIEDQQSLTRAYSIAGDENNPTRVFQDFKEYRIDYSKPLSPANGSWKLVANWGYKIPAALFANTTNLRDVETLGNGRTYGVIAVGSKYQLLELVPKQGTRFIKEIGSNNKLYPDGSLRQRPTGKIGYPQVWKRQNLAGFDSSNNPQWSQPVVVATSPVSTYLDPFPNNIRATQEVTSSGVLVAYDGSAPNTDNKKYHIGGIKIGADGRWLFRVAPQTLVGYNGEFPSNGDYDIGNGVVYAGDTRHIAYGRSIFVGYHGEFWKASQTNKWNQFYDDGLMIGQFGTTRREVNGQIAPAEMAGNGFNAVMLTGTDGNTYLYQGDENDHAGIHRWKISNLTSIKEQTIPIKFSASTRGLVAKYYASADLNNVTVYTPKTRSSVNITRGSKPPGTTPTDTAGISATWEGYIQPEVTGDYTFYTNVARGVRLFVDRDLVIDQWHNSTQNEFKTSANEPSSNAPKKEFVTGNPHKLVAGTRYPIRMETKGGGTITLSWSSDVVPKQVIPQTCLLPAITQDLTNGYSLMEGLPYNAPLPAETNGWKRVPATNDLTNQYLQYWLVKTNVKTYNPFDLPDVYVQFRNENGREATVTRDLGSNVSSNWKLSGKISYEGNYENQDPTPVFTNSGMGGQFFDVLDAKGRLIFRMFIHLNYSTKIATIYANGVAIAQGPQNMIRSVTYRYFNFVLTEDAGSLRVTLANYPTKTVRLSDASADFTRPQTLRLYFWTKNHNYDRKISIKDFLFKKGD